VTVNVASTAGIITGDVVQIFNAPDARLETCGVVTQLLTAPVRVVLQIQTKVAPPPSIAAKGGTIPTQLVVYPTQYMSSGTNITLFYCAAGIGLIKNFALRSLNASGGGIGIASGNGTIENVAAVGFVTGLGVGSGNLFITPLVVCSQCVSAGVNTAPAGGMAIVDSTAAWDRVVFSGNGDQGIWMHGSYLSSGGLTYLFACGNIGFGINCIGGYYAQGTLGNTAGGIIVAYNDTGIQSAFNGQVFTVYDSLNVLGLNVTLDGIASIGGIISIKHNNVIPPVAATNPQNNAAVGDVAHGGSPSGGYITIASP
jgi:hypothetical protein